MLTAAAAWWIGRVVLRALAVEQVERVGAAGLFVAAREGWAARRSFGQALVVSPIAAACAGLLPLEAAWTIVYLSAPEIMYDAVASKAYLPELWAHAGTITSSIAHPAFNNAGMALFDAVPGHSLGSRDTGRGLQMLAWAAIVATIWWWGRRTAAGPVAAVFVGVVPELVWEAQTADDDLVLMLGAMALAIAVLRTVGPRRGLEPTFWAALLIGLLTGACLWLKLHLGALAGLMALGWIVQAGPLRGVPRRLVGVVIGAAVVFVPSTLERWIDVDNPVFPAYNNIFHSPYFRPVNDTLNFPFWPTAGWWDAVKTPYEAVAHPSLMGEALPPGQFGLIVAVIVAGLLVGWMGSLKRSTLILWIAVVVGTVFWWRSNLPART